jgi:hypothetical protein
MRHRSDAPPPRRERLNFRRYVTLIVIVLVAFFIEDQLPTYIFPGNPFTAYGSARLGHAKRVETVIRLDVGVLHLRGGAETLVQGDAGPEEQVIQVKYRFNVQEYKGVIHYTVRDGVGDLLIDHGQPWFVIGDRKVEWDVRLNGEVPLDLTVTNSGHATTLDLSEGWFTDATIQIDGGDISIRLPETVNVTLTAEADDLSVEGLVADDDGTYTFQASNPDAPTLRLIARGSSAVAVRVN